MTQPLQPIASSLLLLSLLLGSAAPMPAAEPTAAPDPAPDFSWLEGRWCLQEGPRLTVETWLPQAGQHWFGVSHAVRDSQVRSFEYLRIGPHEGGWAYFAQPGGRPATAFPLVSHTPTEVRFHNPDHDFPQTIVYQRDGDQLRAEISGPDASGQTQTITYAYRACPSA